MKSTNSTPKFLSPLWITTCALFTGLTVVLSSFGVPFPGGKLYLVDIAIVAASILLDPFGAAFSAGIGTLIGDALYYPEAMFVSLLVHGLQAFVISWCSHNLFKNKPFYGSLTGVILGVIILVTGYTLGKILVFSTLELAIAGIPYELAQGVIGGVSGLLLVYGFGLKKAFARIVSRSRNLSLSR